MAGALSAGYLVKRYTYADNHKGVRAIVAHRITQLRQQYPLLLSHEAVSTWDALPQDILQLTWQHFAALPPVDLIIATPPCTSFSQAGLTNGWLSPHSQPFVACINIIKDLYSTQRHHVSFIFENVPNSSKFLAVRQALGPPLLVNALLLRSTAARYTHVWTNAAPLHFLQQRYLESRSYGPTVKDILQQHGFTN